jgi:hypothetical protein
LVQHMFPSFFNNLTFSSFFCCESKHIVCCYMIS